MDDDIEVPTEKKQTFIPIRPVSNHDNQFQVLRQGELNKHVVTDKKGEKPKRGMWKWSKTYVVLSDTVFMTYRNSNKFIANDMPDEVFDATQCKIRWSGVERSSKKNCFEVFHEKSIVLFYHDDFNEANLWLVTFKEIGQDSH